MKVTGKVNEQYLRQLKKVAQDNLVKTADALRTDLVQSQTMPFDTGNLQNNSTSIDTSKKASNKVLIVSDTPYARRLYFHPEYNFKRDKNPNAGGMWFSPYVSGNKKDFAKKVFAKFMKRSGLL
jgi:hypothetical protein